MEQADTVFVQQVAQLEEELVVVILTDVLEHADRYDAIIALLALPVVAQMEPHALIQTCATGTFLAQLVLLDAQGHPGHLAIRCFGEIQFHAAPAGADVEQLQARAVEQELRGDVALLVVLRLVQVVVGRGEIAAGILSVPVQEEVVELAREIVMMCDVALGPADRIVLLQAAGLAR
jgi:hypothetical protein